MTLIFELDLHIVKMNQRVKGLIWFRGFCPDTQTHTHAGPTAISGPLK